jgi:hypothetical protein
VYDYHGRLLQVALRRFNVVRNKQIDWFMSHAKDCKKPSSLEYETQGGHCTIEAARYIEDLEASVHMLQCTIGDMLEEQAV